MSHSDLVQAPERGTLPGWTSVIERRPSCQLEPARRLMAETDRRMLLPARRIGCDLVPVGVSRLPEKRVNETVRTENGAWKLVDYRDDPAREQYQRLPLLARSPLLKRLPFVDEEGVTPLPLEVATYLQRLDSARVLPHELIVAHELPADWQEGDPIPPVPAPRHLREKDERMKLQLAVGTKLLFAALGGLLVVAASPLLLGAAAVGGAVAGVGVDPIIFGGVRHPELPLVEWCYICSWEWE